MRATKFVCGIAATLLAVSVFASPGGTYRAGGKVLSPGDSVMKVLDTMGEPMTKEPVQNRLGATMGEYWYYRDGSKTVKIFVSGGKIVDIEEIR